MNTRFVSIASILLLAGLGQAGPAYAVTGTLSVSSQPPRL